MTLPAVLCYVAFNRISMSNFAHYRLHSFLSLSAGLLQPSTLATELPKLTDIPCCSQVLVKPLFSGRPAAELRSV